MDSRFEGFESDQEMTEALLALVENGWTTHTFRNDETLSYLVTVSRGVATYTGTAENFIGAFERAYRDYLSAETVTVSLYMPHYTAEDANTIKDTMRDLLAKLAGRHGGVLPVVPFTHTLGEAMSMTDANLAWWLNTGTRKRLGK